MSSSSPEPGSTTGPHPPASPAEPTGEERAAAAELLQLIWGLHISRAVYLAAELGVADLLAAGPRPAAALARATGTDEAALYRVLRLLAALGVLTEPEPRSFGLTIMGDRLRSDAPACMRNWAMLADTVGFRAHEPILDAARTGKTGAELAYGVAGMGHVREDAQRTARFDAAMSERTAAFAPASPPPMTSPESTSSPISAAAGAPSWPRSCTSTSSCAASCSTSRRWRAALAVCCVRPAWRTAAR